MTSFFSQIRGKFKARYSGRYLTTLLSELAYRDADCFSKIFGLKSNQAKLLKRGSLQIKTEWDYKSYAGRRRFVDLAILEGGEPILLIEVKEDDVNNPANAAQLDDYLEMLLLRKGNVRFAHLSRYAPSRNDGLKLKRAEENGLPVLSLRYRHLQDSLQLSKNMFSDLLRDYLRDIGVATYKTIDIGDKDKKSLAYFLAQALGFPHAAGLGRLHSRSAVDEAPDVLKSMMHNLEVLGEWVVESNKDAFAQRFIRKFRPLPEFDIGGLKKELSNIDNDIAPLPGNFGKYVKSGSLSFYTSGTLGSGRVPWLTCELGMIFRVDRAKETRHEPITLEMYAGFYGHHGIYAEEYRPRLKVFPSEQKATVMYSRMLGRALSKAKSQDVTSRHQALTAFNVPGPR